MDSGSTLHSDTNNAPSPSSSISTSTTAVGCIITGGSNPPPFITAEVFENQRWFPLSKWTSAKRLPSDRPTFSNKRGTEELSLTDYKLPKGYAWGSLPSSPANGVGIVRNGGGSHFDAANNNNTTSSSLSNASQAATTSAPIPLENVIGNAWQLEILEGTRTDAEGWRYAVDYKANFGPEMTTTSLVRRRKYYRTAVYVGGGMSPDDGSNSHENDSDERRLTSNHATRGPDGQPLVFSSSGTGKVEINDGSFVFVSNSGGDVKTRTGHGDEPEGGFESCASDGEEGHASYTNKRQKKQNEQQQLCDADGNVFGSAEAQRQAALAALASMKTKEARDAEAAKYFPTDNNCAEAAAGGDDFNLPSTFKAGGVASPTDAVSISQKPMQTAVLGGNSHDDHTGGALSTDHSSYGFRVPNGPYMAVAATGGKHGDGIVDFDSVAAAGLTRDASMQLTLPDPSPLSTDSHTSPDLGTVGTSTSAAEFDAVFRAFVAKEEG